MKPRKIPYGFLALALSTVASMVLIVPVDYAWTVYLAQHDVRTVVDVMRRTVFEGAELGGSDLPIMGALLLIIGYFWASSARARGRLASWRPMLGYLFVSALAGGLGAVHSVKWVVGRARPFSVLGDPHLPYTPWYELGPHYVTEGIYRGSFPSGHTAAVFVLMGLAYCLAGDPLLKRRWRRAGWALGALALVYGVAMAVASSMSKAHWLSDGLAVIGIVWMLLHALYFWGLRVPEQRLYQQAHGGRGPLAARWELRLCGDGFLALLGVMGVAIGLRAFWVEPRPWWAIAIVPCAALLWVFLPRTARWFRNLWAGLAAG